ncbi:PadR family transcriptional regulator [Sphingobium yanoikuyae]|uniref:PadR family transcriptional regulator n=1 Tax=Sphingobium yanoikuyae TaxID=13690 RepID=UPI003204D432
MLFNAMARDRRPSKQMLTLLRALSALPYQWRHGYDLMKDTGLLSGTLYPLLMRMSDQGLVEAEWREPSQPGRPARHAYRLTHTGLALARSVESETAIMSRATELPA